MSDALPRTRLYLITPPAIDVPVFADDLARALDGGDVASVQLRMKDAGDEKVLRAAEALMPVCHARDIALIVNDRPDLAARAGADGVHVGQEDASYRDARTAMGPDAIVGVTCHNSRHLAMAASDAGADYVAFGAFFPTATKDPNAKADLETLRIWQAMTVVPCVAIGGITVDNCRPVLEAGADFVAVVAGIWNYPDGPGAAVAAFNAVFDEVALSHASG